MAGWVTYFVVLIKGFILVLLDLCLLVVLAFGCFWLCLRCFVAVVYSGVVACFVVGLCVVA